ncbi:MAG TPA: energy transducer TonB [Salinivirgaceae bacterium]|nr:energy transducer TonB [Salinivirgaceae bacterium]
MSIKNLKIKSITALVVCGFIVSCGSNTGKQQEQQSEEITQEEPQAFEVSTSDSIYLVSEEQTGWAGTEEERLEKLTPDPKKFKVTEKQTVFVSFVIEKDSTASSFKIVKGVNEELDKEALRLVESIEKWIPAVSEGKVVRSAFTYPVQFLPEK